MKIVLINPKPEIWIESRTLPLGLAYIASFLISKGYKNLEVIDLNLKPNKLIPNADIYFITATTPLINSAFNLANKLKNKDCKIVFGGAHPTCLPDEALSNHNIDFVIRGEGEITSFELLESLKNNKSYSEIKGISFRNSNEIIHNPDRDFIKNLDDLPFPAYNLWRSKKIFTSPTFAWMEKTCCKYNN